MYYREILCYGILYRGWSPEGSGRMIACAQSPGVSVPIPAVTDTLMESPYEESRGQNCIRQVSDKTEAIKKYDDKF